MHVSGSALSLAAIIFPMAASAQVGQSAAPVTSLSGAEASPGSGKGATDAHSDSAASIGLEEIIVTAQRRSENLQRVPIAVQSISANSLKATGSLNLATLPNAVPGLVIQRSLAGASPFMRGIGSTTSGFTAELPVAVYLDGVYLSNAASNVFDLSNIARVEVLKGPQGTLFGRNAVGGLINIVTRDPATERTIEAHAGYGNYDTISGDLYASTGNVGNFAVDVSAMYRDQRKGWGHNLITGKEVNKNREEGVTTKVRWDPGADTTVTARLLYSHASGDLGTIINVYPGSIGTDGSTAPTNYLDSATRITPFNKREQFNASLRIEQDLGFARLISISGYNYAKSDTLSVVNGIVGQPTFGQSAINLGLYGHSHTYSQELQLQSEASSPVRWIIGAFYLNDHFNELAPFFLTCVADVCAPDVPPFSITADQKLTSYAAFADITVPITDQLRITGGLRYTKDKKDLSGAHRDPVPSYPTSVPEIPAEFYGPNNFSDPGAVSPFAKSSALTWRAVIAYDVTPDIMTYVSANRGFKGAAYNPFSFTNPVARPEKIDAFEGGLKSSLFDHRLRINISAFYYNYRDIQLDAFGSSVSTSEPFLFNAASAHIKGIDAEFELAASRRLTLNGALAVLDPKFKSFPAGVCTFPLAVGPGVLGGVGSTSCSLAGKDTRRAPRFTANFGATYHIPSSIGQFTLVANDAYNGGFFWDSDNRLKQRAYHLVNASITWTSSDEIYSARLFANNLNNAKYFMNVLEASSGTDVAQAGDPRTYGFQLGFKF